MSDVLRDGRGAVVKICNRCNQIYEQMTTGFCPNCNCPEFRLGLDPGGVVRREDRQKRMKGGDDETK